LLTSARQLSIEHHQLISMTPGELWKLLARFQRRTVELLAAIGQAGLEPERADGPQGPDYRLGHAMAGLARGHQRCQDRG
jgi:hypothetical protein